MTSSPSFGFRAATQARLLVQRAGFDVVREPFRHRFVHLLHQHGVSAVLDVGANTGQFGQALRRARWAGRIVSIEPLSDAFAQLSSVAAGDPRWEVQRAAVSAEPGRVTLNVSANSVSSSVLPMLSRHTDAAPQTAYVATEEVEATTVDKLVARHGLDPAGTLLKIDVQGYERPVLEGAVATLASVAAVRTELSLVPLYDGQALMPEIVELLAGQGLSLWQIEPGFVDPVSRRLLQLDGMFFRD